MPLRARQPQKTSGRRRYRLTAWVAPRLQPKHGLVHDVAEPLLVAADAPVGVAVGVRPGFSIQRVDGKHHHLAGVDPRGQRVGHVEVLKIKEAAILAGDIEDGAACMAVYLALHLSAQGGTVILKILHFHRGYLLLCPLRLFRRPFSQRESQGHLSYSSPYIRVWNTNGSCFSQLASLWVPPGTTRAVRLMPRAKILPHISPKPFRIPSWLPISLEP